MRRTGTCLDLGWIQQSLFSLGREEATINVRRYLTGTTSSVVLGPNVPIWESCLCGSDGPLCLLMVRAMMWPLKHPICPDRIALKGHFPLLSMFSGGNRACKGKCKFFKDGEGRQQDFYYKLYFYYKLCFEPQS